MYQVLCIAQVKFIKHSVKYWYDVHGKLKTIAYYQKLTLSDMSEEKEEIFLKLSSPPFKSHSLDVVGLFHDHHKTGKTVVVVMRHCFLCRHSPFSNAEVETAAELAFTDYQRWTNILSDKGKI